MKYLKLHLLIYCLIGVVSATSGQNYELNPKAQEAMKSLTFLEGNWEGNGWMISQDQKRYEFQQTEEVKYQLSGTHLMIIGKGVSEGKVIHHALAMISPKSAEGKFDFSSYLQSGQKGSFSAEWKEGKFYWYPSEQVRYVIQINDSGQWYEIGEYNMGERWIQFFEMTLDKVLDEG